MFLEQMTGFVPDESSCSVPGFVLGTQLNTDSENKVSSIEEEIFDCVHHSNVPSSSLCTSEYQKKGNEKY